MIRAFSFFYFFKDFAKIIAPSLSVVSFKEIVKNYKFVLYSIS